MQNIYLQTEVAEFRTCILHVLKKVEMMAFCIQYVLQKIFIHRLQGSEIQRYAKPITILYYITSNMLHHCDNVKNIE